MGQPISHPAKSGFSRRRDRAFRIRRETARPCEAIIEAQSGREIGACGEDRGPSGEIAGAGHASATGRFDDLQLFYLMSRGIAEEDARRMVVRGFFASVVARIGVPEVEERLMAAIDAELEGAVK